MTQYKCIKYKTLSPGVIHYESSNCRWNAQWYEPQWIVPYRRQQSLLIVVIIGFVKDSNFKRNILFKFSDSVNRLSLYYVTKYLLCIDIIMYAYWHYKTLESNILFAYTKKTHFVCIFRTKSNVLFLYFYI